MSETVDQRLLHDAELEMLAQMGKPPNAAEWAVYWRKVENVPTVTFDMRIWYDPRSQCYRENGYE